MASWFRLLFGRNRDEDSPEGRVTDAGEPVISGSHLKLDGLSSGQRITVKTDSGSIYRIRIIDPQKGAVEVRGNPAYFPTPAPCVLLGAVKINRACACPRVIVEGMSMVFVDVPIPGKGLTTVTTSYVVSWYKAEPSVL